ncbi:MAG TPA: group III truncated hemoglobin [Solirubrobacterales bacterium]|nr:group III truncated hemoglobin [Solirubrobacterales bacterium]
MSRACPAEAGPPPSSRLGRRVRRSGGDARTRPGAPSLPEEDRGDRHDSRIATEALPDIETAADCERIVRAFYGKAMADEKIGWIFTDVAELDLEEHVPKITAFWATNLLGAKSYRGGAFGVHGRLHQMAAGGLRQEHFERWLVLWCQTVDEMYDGPIAAAAKVHALRVANAFYGRLQMYPVADEPTTEASSR